MVTQKKKLSKTKSFKKFSKKETEIILLKKIVQDMTETMKQQRLVIDQFLGKKTEEKKESMSHDCKSSLSYIR